MNGRQRILAMLEGGRPDRLPLMPIAMMFAADQIGAKYRQYVADCRVLVAGQLRTAERFDIDHVSCISDPTREAADCGADIRFFPDQPPAFAEGRSLLADKAALRRLKVPDPLGGGRMHDRVRAAAMLKEKVGRDRLVEGWVEGPGSAASGLRGLNTLMLDFHDDPPFVRDLLEFAVEMELRFAAAQVEAGAEIIGVGDSMASLIGPALYGEFLLPLHRRMFAGIREMGAKVRLHICGNIDGILGPLAGAGADMIDIDSPVPMDRARRELGPQQVLLGNLDPVAALRNGTPQGVAEALAACHRHAGPRYIVGAGCEVPRDTPPANLTAMTEYARSHGPHENDAGAQQVALSPPPREEEP